MATLSPLSTLDKPDPATQADHDALATLVDAPSTPANWLESDWLGAIVSDLEPSADEQRALDHVDAMVMFGDMLLRHAIGLAAITWLDGDARRLWTLWNLSQA